MNCKEYRPIPLDSYLGQLRGLTMWVRSTREWYSNDFWDGYRREQIALSLLLDLLQ